MNECTNNLLTTTIYLEKYRQLDIACIYCKQVYRLFSKKQLSSNNNKTLCCKMCNMESMVPITPGSTLYHMECDERRYQILKWHEEWFTELNDEQEYLDYEYKNAELLFD